MRTPRRLLRSVDEWLFAVEDARRLAAIRICLCGLVAIRLATTDYDDVAMSPVFRPQFYMTVFERMPSASVATALQIVGIVAATVAAAGLAVRVSLPVAASSSLLLDGMLNSAGRVIVGDAVLLLCLLLLVASGAAAAEAWSIRIPGWRLRRALARRSKAEALAPRPFRSGPRYGWPVRTSMVAITLAYFFAGFQKWRYSGLSWVTSDNLRWILYASSDRHVHPNGLALAIADRPWLAHLFAAGALTLETCFPLVLFVPRLRWFLIAGVMAMHVGVSLALGLDYSAQWLTTVIVFANWPEVADWSRRLLQRKAQLGTIREAPG